jgi:hypothetical protein
MKIRFPYGMHNCVHVKFKAVLATMLILSGNSVLGCYRLLNYKQKSSPNSSTSQISLQIPS